MKVIYNVYEKKKKMEKKKAAVDPVAYGQEVNWT